MRQQFEVVCFGLTLTLLSVLLPTVAVFCRLLPSRIRRIRMERVATGDMCRYRNDTSKVTHVSTRWRFLVVRFSLQRKKFTSLDTRAAGFASSLSVSHW